MVVDAQPTACIHGLQRDSSRSAVAAPACSPAPSPRQTDQPNESASQYARSLRAPPATSPARPSCRSPAPRRMSMPNLCSRSPVEMYGCVSANTSGFTRSANRAFRFSLRARAASSSSSASLSTLNSRIPASSAAIDLRRRLAHAREHNPPRPPPAQPPSPAPAHRQRQCRSPRRDPPAASESPAPSSPSPHSTPDARAPQTPLKQSQPLHDLIGRVDIQRRAEFLRQAFERHLPAMQRALRLRVIKRTGRGHQCIFQVSIQREVSLLSLSAARHFTSRAATGPRIAITSTYAADTAPSRGSSATPNPAMTIENSPCGTSINPARKRAFRSSFHLRVAQ